MGAGVLDTSHRQRRISKEDTEPGPAAGASVPKLGLCCHLHTVWQCRVLEEDAVLHGLGSAC